MESRLCAVAGRVTPQRRIGDPRDCDKPRTLDPLPLIFVRLHERRAVEPDQAPLRLTAALKHGHRPASLIRAEPGLLLL